MQLLWLVRRYCAKLLYELEFHAAADVTPMRTRYVELLGDALKVEPSPDRLPRATSTPASTSRLPARRGRSRRSCATSCASEFGNDWFAQREAGSLLRELWSLGQSATADELLKDVTGATLDMGAVVARAREPLG